MKYFVKNLFRSAKKSPGTYIGATFIMALGIFIFVSMNDTFINLKSQVYSYYEENNMADIFAGVISMPKERLKSFEDYPGIKKASGILSADLRVTGEKIKDIANLHVLSYDKDAYLNRPLLKPDIIPGNEQIFIGAKMMKSRHLKEGDTLSLIHNGESYDFIVAGVASAPNYIYAIPPSGAVISDGKDYDIAIVNSDKLSKMLGREDTVNEISFEMEKGYSYEVLRYELRERLSQFGLQSFTNKEKQSSYNMVDGEIKELTGTGTILPAIFMSMSVFMLYTVLKKMIDNDRSLIGTMKAMGLGNSELIGAYLVQAILISFVGALLGCIPARSFGKYMFNQYAEFFSLPSPIYIDPVSTKLKGFLIAALASLVAVIFGVGGIAKIQAAEAMRAATPKVNNNFSFGFIKNFNVMHKMGIRSILRSPFRTFFIAFAIAFPFSMSCTLMASQNAINKMFIGYFRDIAKYDVKITLENYSDADKAFNALGEIEGVGEREVISEIPITLKSKNHSKITLLSGINRGSNLYRISDVDDVFYEPPTDGIILNKRIAKDLNVKEGDRVEISTGYAPKKKTEISVTHVISEAFGSGCYVDIKNIEKYLSLSNFSNTLIFNTERGSEDIIKKTLTEDTSQITSFSSKKDTLRIYEDRMKSSKFMLQMFIYLSLFSGVVLIYNISLISIRERKTEFATMKIMGVLDKELRQMIFMEQVVYLIAGLILSIPLIRVFKWILESLLVSDSYTLRLHIEFSMYVASLIFCVMMLYISGRAILKIIKKINPNDSLKERG
nr:FtsX-like permease family protein [uncultured Lachnoanaerobaculum sp.]